MQLFHAVAIAPGAVEGRSVGQRSKRYRSTSQTACVRPVLNLAVEVFGGEVAHVIVGNGSESAEIRAYNESVTQ